MLALKYIGELSDGWFSETGATWPDRDIKTGFEFLSTNCLHSFIMRLKNKSQV